MTLGEALAAGAAILDKNHVPSPRLTAEVLLAHFLGVDRPFLYVHRDDALEPAPRRAYEASIDRRASGEPLQYITGVQEFYGRTFSVDPSVLIPRPETELVIETVLASNRWTRPRVVDIGTGSGSIAVTLALELPGAVVLASDISFDALRVARANALRLGARVGFVQADLLDAWAGPFEFVVSNPPYIGSAEYEGLQREVREHEPGVALLAGGDSRRVYRRLAEEAAERLISGGQLVLEIGYSMEEAVRSLFREGWELLPTRNDLQGIPRVVAARKA